MGLLIAGLAVFLAIHLVPSAPGLRAMLIAKFGGNGYKGIFSLISLLAMILIVYGLIEAPFEELYEPPVWGRHLNMLLMLPAVYLSLSNPAFSTPSSAKTFTAHPSSWGVILWAVGHLLANGDLAHVLLFACFILFCTISIISGNARGLKPAAARPPLAKEAILVIVALLLYAALFWGHPYITGMPLIL